MTKAVNRRGALAVLVSPLALAIPASVEGAALADPVLAAIERHRAAEAAYVDAINPADSVWCRQHGRECTEAAQAALEAAEAASGEALDALLDTPPLSLGGLRALVAYFIEIEDDLAPTYGHRVLPTLLLSPLLNT